MFATAMRVKDFPDEPDQEFFQGLAGLADELKLTEPGFVQAYFMRDTDGGALVLALWQNEQVAADVLESKVGEYARQLHERFLSSGEAQTYTVTWTAVFGDEYSKLASRRRIVDPDEKKKPKKPKPKPKPRQPRG
jgi:hypothetical protein